MYEQKLWYHRSLIPISAGLLWLYAGMQNGNWWIWTAVPGALLITTGAGLLLFAGDRRVQQFLAFGALLSCPWALPLVFGPGWWWVPLFWGLAALCFTTAGRASVLFEPHAAEVPQPPLSELLAAKVAMDDAVVAYFVLAAEIPDAEKCQRMQNDVETLVGLDQVHGWSSEPDRLHAAPCALRDIRWSSHRFRGAEYRRIRFNSGYAPHAELPGIDSWMQSRANRYGHARVIQHTHAAPWLLCIHGYRMGRPDLDFSLFDIDWLHHELGFNLLMPILPRHGPRRIGVLSGSGYIDGEITDILHAELQAMHDIRSLLAWVRNEPGGERVATLGYSLGGYNAALLSCFEPALEAVIAAIPLADIPAGLWRHMPLQQRRYLVSLGLNVERMQAALRVVSPLSLRSRVDTSRLTIIGAAADQVAPPQHALWLRDHWGVPEVKWYPGAHLTVRRERLVRKYIAGAFADAGLIAERGTELAASAP